MQQDEGEREGASVREYWHALAQIFLCTLIPVSLVIITIITVHPVCPINKQLFFTICGGKDHVCDYSIHFWYSCHAPLHAEKTFFLFSLGSFTSEYGQKLSAFFWSEQKYQKTDRELPAPRGILFLGAAQHLPPHSSVLCLEQAEAWLHAGMTPTLLPCICTHAMAQTAGRHAFLTLQITGAELFHTATLGGGITSLHYLISAVNINGLLHIRLLILFLVEIKNTSRVFCLPVRVFNNFNLVAGAWAFGVSAEALLSCCCTVEMENRVS